MPVLTLRQQHTRDKGTERHRQPQRIHKQGRSQHQQQRRGGKHLAYAGGGNKPEHRAEQIAPSHQHAGKGQHLHADLHPVEMFLARSCQQWNQRQRRDHRQILKQQDREAQLPRFVAVHALIAHQL